MHDFGIVLASEDITGATHIRCELIDLIKASIQDLAAGIRIPEVSAYEIICLHIPVL